MTEPKDKESLSSSSITVSSCSSSLSASESSKSSVSFSASDAESHTPPPSPPSPPSPPAEPEEHTPPAPVEPIQIPAMPAPAAPAEEPEAPQTPKDTAGLIVPVPEMQAPAAPAPAPPTPAEQHESEGSEDSTSSKEDTMSSVSTPTPAISSDVVSSGTSSEDEDAAPAPTPAPVLPTTTTTTTTATQTTKSVIEEDAGPAYKQIKMPSVPSAREKREKEKRARLSAVVEPAEHISAEQAAAAQLPLRGLTAGKDKYQVCVTFLDNSTAECEVTSDWSVGDLIAAVAHGMGLGKVSALFHLSEGMRNGSLPISSTNFEKWLPRSSLLGQVGITAERIKTAGLPPLVLRMRWFAMPVHELAQQPEVAHQVYLHVRRSLTQECVPLDEGLAVALAALQCQAAWGDYSDKRCPAGTLARARAGAFFSSEVLRAAGDADRLEERVLAAWRRHTGVLRSDAEARYVRMAMTSSCPLTGGTAYEYKAANGAQQVVVVLRDGVALYVDGAFRFVPFVDVAAIALADAGTATELVVLTHDPNPMRASETLRFTAHEPANLHDLLRGYYCLARPLLPPAAPDTTAAITAPPDLPRPDLFEPYPLRENILVAPSVAHYFVQRYRDISRNSAVPLCRDIERLVHPVLRPFDKSGFNEYEYLLAMARKHQQQQQEQQQDHQQEHQQPTRGGVASADEMLPFAVMTTLDLSGVALKKRQLGAVAQALADASAYMNQRGIAQNLSVAAVDLSGAGCGTDEVLEAVATLCASKLPLRRVALRRVGLAKKHVGALAAALVACSTLVEVDVGGNALGNEGVAALADALAQDLPDFDALGCSEAGLTRGVLPLLQNTVLQKRRPTRVRCAGNPFGRAGAKKWAELLANTALRDVDLSACRLDSKAALDVADALPAAQHLERLRLADTKLGKAALASLTTHIADGTSHVTTLDLTNAPASKKQVRALLAALASERSACTSITLSGVPVPKDAGDALAALGNKRGLRALRLRNCRLRPAAWKGLAALVAASDTLVLLDVARNALPSDRARPLADAVARSRALAELDLAHCIGDYKDLIALFEALAANTALLSLHVSGARIGGKCPTHIADFVNSTTSAIEHLDLRHCTVAEAQLLSLLKAIDPDKHCPLRKLDLRGIPVPHPDLLERALERLRSTLVLY